ncbi:hypothetical protein EPN52_04060 [bacterium]|nr:MAG: hypothetical protein EPN52_04060 [bacterium]
MRQILGALAAVLALVLAFFLAAPAPSAGAGTNLHRVAIQVSDDNPEHMNLALNNAANMSVYYTGLGQDVQVEIVAYGPGLNMLLADTSPVKARLKSFAEGMPNVKFDACNNTLEHMEKQAGKKLALVPEAHLVPSGVVRLVTLEEQGWSYIKE